LFDPLEFLHIARVISSQNSTECGLRTAIGRTYYSLFLIARERVDGTLINRRIRRRDPIHKTVVNRVKEKDTAIGNKLDSLRKLRVEADYYLSPSKPEYQDWKKNWQRADLIARDIEKQIQKI
jgi:hypothetical protein